MIKKRCIALKVIIWNNFIRIVTDNSMWPYEYYKNFEEYTTFFIFTLFYIHEDFGGTNYTQK